MACKRRVRTASIGVFTASVATACGAHAPADVEKNEITRAPASVLDAPEAAAATPTSPAHDEARPSRAPIPTEPFSLAEGDAPPVYVVPPRDTGAHTFVTMLHGMCSAGEHVCPNVSDALADGDYLVCPSGNGRCGGDADWVGDPGERAAFVTERLDRVAERVAEPVTRERSVLMGFSRGAFAARDVVYASEGRFTALVLIGAAIVPDPAKLKRSGVERVVLASGDHDGARATMLRARTVLCAKGIPARFVSLGPVWHALPADSGARLRDALAWAKGEAPLDAKRDCG